MSPAIFWNPSCDESLRVRDANVFRWRCAEAAGSVPFARRQDYRREALLHQRVFLARQSAPQGVWRLAVGLRSRCDAREVPWPFHAILRYARRELSPVRVTPFRVAANSFPAPASV